MSLPPGSVCFFDLTSTLAFVLLSADGKQVNRLAPYPGVHRIVQELRENGVRVGAIIHCGEVLEESVRVALGAAGFDDFADGLLLVPNGSASAAVFEHAAAFAQTSDESEGPRLFVSADEALRDVASRAGFRTAPHPKLAYTVLRRDSPLRYLRIRVPTSKYGRDWVPALRAHRVVPLHVTTEPLEGAAPTVYAIADARTAAALDDLGFWVDRLGAPDEPMTTSLYLIRGDRRMQRGFLEPSGDATKFYARGPGASRVLASTFEGLLVALTADTPVETFRPAGSHYGHAHKLTPSLNLFEDRNTVAERTAMLSRAAAAAPLCDREREILDRHFAPGFMAKTVAKYAGTGEAVAGGLILSRHVKHDGNRLAVEALVEELREIAPGQITVERHCFSHDGAELTNVVATLPTSDMEGQGVVVISAHLDSTADLDGDNYNSATDRAPGADDDASGVAAVIAAAHAFAELAALRKPHREIRFALFNCEEIDKSGSGTYTAGLGSCGVEIAATFHIDMIGYHTETSECLFEVHAGFFAPEAPNAEIAKQRSAETAHLIEHLRPIITKLPRTEISTTLEDDGLGRSDHTMFHKSGYPACWITEDFFPEDGPLSRSNPNYHTSCDTEIKPDYTAEIARLIGAAAWIAATR